VKIELDGQYSDGLNALDGFGHVVVLWWAHKYVEYRNQIDMVIDLPYAPGTKAGLFATRSPVRPNPVCVSTAEIREISIKKGVIVIDEIDAADGTPVLDIKPYYGTTDRVDAYRQPEWVPDDWPVWRMPIGEEDYGEES
jgi:tRNA (adenine37-N6)-methyltransferase